MPEDEVEQWEALRQHLRDNPMKHNTITVRMPRECDTQSSIIKSGVCEGIYPVRKGVPEMSKFYVVTRVTDGVVSYLTEEGMFTQTDTPKISEGHMKAFFDSVKPGFGTIFTAQEIEAVGYAWVKPQFLDRLVVCQSDTKLEFVTFDHTGGAPELPMRGLIMRGDDDGELEFSRSQFNPLATTPYFKNAYMFSVSNQEELDRAERVRTNMSNGITCDILVVYSDIKVTLA
jgi:hypothetical protein